MGYDFVSIAGDVWLLQQAFAAGTRNQNETGPDADGGQNRDPAGAGGG